MNFIDHGTSLAHDMNGQPLHYTKQLSIKRGTKMRRSGYQYAYGWVDRFEVQWDLYTRCIPATELKSSTERFGTDRMGTVCS